MYIVVIEDGCGMWFDDPEGTDTRREAMDLAKIRQKRLHPDHLVKVYRCTHEATFGYDADAEPPVTQIT